MTRKPDEWMPLHIGAYHADTTHLTRDQHGAYLLLLMAYWRRGGALPASDARLAAIVKATVTEWRKLKPVMAEFFEERNGYWHQKRADEELAKAKRMTEAKAEAGRKGAEKKWQGHSKADGKMDGTEMAEPSVRQWQTDAPIPSPLPEQVEDTSLRSVSPPQAADPPRARKVRSKIEPEGFAEFYQAYPLHKARPAAAKAYCAALTRGTAEALLDGAIRYATARANDDPKFTKHPATWLNNDCWMDQEVSHETSIVRGRGRAASGQLTFIEAGASLINELFADGQAESGNDNPAALEIGRPLLSG